MGLSGYGTSLIRVQHVASIESREKRIIAKQIDMRKDSANPKPIIRHDLGRRRGQSARQTEIPHLFKPPSRKNYTTLLGKSQ